MLQTRVGFIAARSGYPSTPVPAPAASRPPPPSPRPVPTPAPEARESAPAVIARNLVVARDLVGMTQHELAARSGVSRATVAQLESGESDPRLSTLTDIAQALGVSPLVLLAGRREVRALGGLGESLTADPVRIDPQEQARMQAFASSPLHRDQGRAARLGASVARAAGCRSPGAAATAGIFSVVVPGRGTVVGTALGRLLE